jgi:flagellar hook-basal body complex protein FliE
MPVEPVGPVGAAPGPSSPQQVGQAVAGLFERLVEQAAQLERAAESEAARLARGEGDVARAMLALQEAALGIGILAQARDRVLAAYQQLMSMPV